MSPIAVIALVVYSALAVGGLIVTGIVPAMWRYSFRDVFPEMLKGFWDVYPGRRWPGLLKVIGLPMTFVFLALVAAAFVLFHVLMLIVASPVAAWRFVERLARRTRKGPPKPPPAVEAKMRVSA
jgi:hypothetical protein